MHVISKKRLREFWEKHPDAREPLLRWYEVTRKAEWKSLADVKRDFPQADLVGICTVFNIHGNDFRLIAWVNYSRRKVFIRFALTHREYDRGRWKNDCEC